MAVGEEHFRRLVSMYGQAPCNLPLKPILQISDGHAELRMQATPEMHHAAGSVHGSFYFKMLDDAAYFAANSKVTDVLVLTVSFTLHMMLPVEEGLLRATGRVVRAGERMLFAESALIDAQGRDLARGSGVFARSNVRLTEESGYR